MIIGKIRMNECNPAWGSHFSSEEIEQSRRSGRILTMELELSRACNLRCIYCYAESGTALENELDLQEIQDTVDQALELGARRIIVLGGGEPLAHPQIMPILRYISQKGAAIDLFTNATLITPDLARELISLKVSPVIKMNSMRQDVQDFLAGKPGTFDRIRHGLNCLVKAGYPAQDLDLGVQTVICSQNLEELPSMWTWIRKQGMIPYFETITLQGRARNYPDILVSPEAVHDLFHKLAALDRNHFGIEWEPHPPVAGLTCNRHLYTCTVTVKGDVYPCPGVDIAVGNIRNSRLGDILNQSKVIRDLRGIRENIKGACRNCESVSYCYGCRGMAYQFTGDYLAADPLCWKNPEQIDFKAPRPVCAKGLMPHKRPMRMVDRVLSAEEDASGKVEAIIRGDCLYVDQQGFFAPEAMVELMAQAFAAVSGKLSSESGGQQGTGYLTGVKQARIYAKARSEDLLTIEVKPIAEFAGFVIVESRINREDELLAQGELKIWQTSPAEQENKS